MKILNHNNEFVIIDDIPVRKRDVVFRYVDIDRIEFSNVNTEGRLLYSEQYFKISIDGIFYTKKDELAIVLADLFVFNTAGTLNADDIDETPTRKWQSANQDAFNDATSSIQTQLDGKENAFSKNTAFNKNFGTSSGTVAEGNHTHAISGITGLQSALNDKQATLTETNFGAFANGLNTKTTLVDNDIAIIGDSEDSNKAKKSTWLNIKNFFANFFVSKTGAETIAGVKTMTDDFILSKALAFRDADGFVSLFTPSSSIDGGSSKDANLYVYGNNPFGIWTNGVKRVIVGGDGSIALRGVVAIGSFTTGTEPAYVKGAMYYNSTLSKLRVGGVSGWETVKSGAPALVSTGSTIQFDTDRIYNSIGSPTTGAMTNDLTGAQIGVIQKIYYNHSTTNPFPAGWVRLGSKTYTPSALNIIYAEWVGASRVEYWISQEA